MPSMHLQQAEELCGDTHLHQQVELGGGVPRLGLARLDVLLQAVAQVLQVIM